MSRPEKLIAVQMFCFAVRAIVAAIAGGNADGPLNLMQQASDNILNGRYPDVASRGR